MNSIRTPRTIALFLIASSMGLAACTPGEGDMKEAPTDSDVSTSRETSTATGVVVSSELSAVTQVRGWTCDDAGNLSSDAGSESTVRADGSFEMDVQAEESLYVVEALDSSGRVVGMAMIESTGEVDGDTTVTPIDMESTVEASTWLSLAADSASTSAWSYADVRERVGAELAAAAYGSWESEGSASSDITLIANSIAVAQEAELKAWTESGATVDQDEMSEAEHEASARLSAELYAAITSGANSTDAAHEAQERFAAELRATAQASTGLGVDAMSEASTTSWMAQSAVVEASAGAESDLSKGVKIAWGEGQSVRTDEVVVAMIAELNASSESEAEAAGDTLEGDAWTATELNAMADAWASYGETVVGDGSGESLLGAALGIDVISELAYGEASSACLTGASELYTDLVVDAQGHSSSNMSASEISAMATAAVDARADFRSDLEASASGLASWLGNDTLLDATLQTMLAADGSFVGSASR